MTNFICIVGILLGIRLSIKADFHLVHVLTGFCIVLAFGAILIFSN
jgi:hypothetical protein